MPVNSRPRRIRPNSAPAYYLGRPASLWISVTTGHTGCRTAYGDGSPME